MGFMAQIGELLERYTSGRGTDRDKQDIRDHYDRIANSVPQDELGSVIGPALGSLGTEQVQERVRNSAVEMNESQRGDFVQRMIQGISGSGGNIGWILSRLGINRQVQNDPNQATPGDVATLTAHVHETRPDIFNRAMQFYAQHPTLVKVLGAMAIAKIAQQLSARQAQGGVR